MTRFYFVPQIHVGTNDEKVSQFFSPFAPLLPREDDKALLKRTASLSRSGVPPNESDKVVAIVIETISENYWLRQLGLIACLNGSSPSFYYEITPELRSILEDDGVTKVFYDSADSASFLRQNGVEVRNAQCLSLLAKIIGDYDDLNYLSYKYLDKMLWRGREDLAEQDILAEAKTEALWELYPILKEQVKKRGLSQVYCRENRANAILPRLICDGISFDFGSWNRVLDEDRNEMVEMEEEIRTMLGDESLNLSSPPQIMQAFRQIGIHVLSTSTDELMAIESVHPVIPLLLRYRKKPSRLKPMELT